MTTVICMHMNKTVIKVIIRFSCDAMTQLCQIDVINLCLHYDVMMLAGVKSY